MQTKVGVSIKSFLLLLVVICCMFCSILAKEVQKELKNTTSLIITNSSSNCWKDGKLCNPDTTCDKCCAGTSYTNKTSTSKVGTTKSIKTVCGPAPKELKCIDDGIVCYGIDGEYNCDKCCNGYLDDHNVCGVKCWKKGQKCNDDGSCQLCCDNKHVVKKDEKKFTYHECGCYPDGTRCVPGDTCFSCCNGAYDKKGWACGGTCLPDGTPCKKGENCQFCCNREEFWISTGQLHCGIEPCYPDGDRCIPDVSCTNCCSGGAYDGDGTVCGGTCLPAGTECTYAGTCRACCQGYNWDEKKGTGVCDPPCLDDGNVCIPSKTCPSCCNGAYDDFGSKCGGDCIKNGVACDYYTTCNFCCETSMLDVKMGKHICIDYDSASFD
jgi:hypothetical protein